MQEHYFKKINSTQDYAKKLSLDNESDFVVYADAQSLGRGRNGHAWISPSGGLWFSFDMMYLEGNGAFTLAIGVAVREVLEEFYRCNVELKWPNDIVFNRKKVGGIICEKIGDKVIVGIGINTNVKAIDQENAETFINITGVRADNYKMMKCIITKCKEVIDERLDTVIESFRAYMAYVGEECFVSSINQRVKIIDVASTGHLVVESKDGIKEVCAGEISVCI